MTDLSRLQVQHCEDCHYRYTLAAIYFDKKCAHHDCCPGCWAIFQAARHPWCKRCGTECQTCRDAAGEQVTVA